jgi:hypothetical protein
MNIAVSQIPRLSSVTEKQHPSNRTLYTNDVDSSAVRHTGSQRGITTPVDASAKTIFDFDFTHSTRYSPPPFELALVQQRARLCTRRLLDCFASGYQSYQASTRRAFRFLLRKIQVRPELESALPRRLGFGQYRSFCQISISPPLWYSIEC